MFEIFSHAGILQIWSTRSSIKLNVFLSLIWFWNWSKTIMEVIWHLRCILGLILIKIKVQRKEDKDVKMCNWSSQEVIGKITFYWRSQIWCLVFFKGIIEEIQKFFFVFIRRIHWIFKLLARVINFFEFLMFELKVAICNFWKVIAVGNATQTWQNQ